MFQEHRVTCYVDNIILVYGTDRDAIFLIIVQFRYICPYKTIIRKYFLQHRNAISVNFDGHMPNQ